MPLHLTKNPYQGVNAHFNSYLQNLYGGWVPFHTKYIANLTDEITDHLPPGYIALAEQAMQVREDELHAATRPDIAILQPLASTNTEPTSAPTLELELALPPEEYITSVEIYDVERARLVTRLELLSPSNKRKPQDYLAMRRRMLHWGVNMVEIDFLHQLPPLFPDTLADYSQQAADAYPYCISVLTAEERRARFFCFGIDEPLPILNLPLRGEAQVTVDFDRPYQKTLEKDRRTATYLDYAQPPLQFHTYSLADQARIQDVMARLKEES